METAYTIESLEDNKIVFAKDKEVFKETKEALINVLIDTCGLTYDEAEFKARDYIKRQMNFIN